MPSNYHTHSIYCDGRDAPSEMAEKAFSLGFAGHHFAAVLTAITGDSGAERYLLRIAKEGHGGQTYRKNIMFQSFVLI